MKRYQGQEGEPPGSLAERKYKGGVDYSTHVLLIALRAPIARVLYSANYLAGRKETQREEQLAAACQDLLVSSEEIASWMSRLQRLAHGSVAGPQAVSLLELVDISQQLSRSKASGLRVVASATLKGCYVQTEPFLVAYLVSELVLLVAAQSAGDDVFISEQGAPIYGGSITIYIGKLPLDHETGVYLRPARSFQSHESVHGGALLGNDAERVEPMGLAMASVLAKQLRGEIVSHLDGDDPHLELVLPRGTQSGLTEEVG